MDSIAENIDIKKKFVEEYETKVFPFLKGHEVLRRKLNENCNFKIIIAWFVYLTSLLLVYIFTNNYDPLLYSIRTFYLFMISWFIVICIIYFSYSYKNKKNKEFCLNLKSHCFEYLLPALGDIKWSNNKNIITDGNLEKSELFAMFNKRTIDDELTGTYKNTKFKACETQLLYISGSGKNRSCTNVFKGIVLEFKLNKTFKTQTVISTKGDLTARDNHWLWAVFALTSFVEPITKCYTKGDYISGNIFLAIGLLIAITIFTYSFFSKNKNKEQKIILEDVKFNKKYHVYSDDQVEARCIVTPAFMEKFLNIRTAFGAKNAKCAFYGNKIMFAISTNKNLFEIGSLNKSLLEPKSFSNLYREISAIYELIDYFKLNNY